MIRFIVFLAMMLGSFWIMGAAFGMQSNQAITFAGGLLLFCLAIASLMHWPGSATRSSTWDGSKN